MKNTSTTKGFLYYYYPILLIGLIITTPSYATRHTSQKTDIQQTTQLAQHTITGKATFDNMPLSGVTIQVKGKTTSTITDENGNYTIPADATDTLIFTYTGFKTVEIPVDGKTVIHATMHEDITALQQVTVNAGYYNVKESERTGSIAKVTAKDIEKQPVANILNTMQGRMAGVNVTQESGIAGGGFSVTIRGLNSLRRNGNEPLYVIDGVPYSSEPISYSTTSVAIPGDGNPLSSINPNDVESLEILKDADATAIYGSRGATGVVLITTKKGKSGKTVFTASTQHGIGTVTRMMDLMHTEDYLAMRRKAFANDGIEPGPADYDVNGTWSQDRYTDWQEELIGGTSEIDNWQMSASGGTGQTKFLLSGNYRTETTVFPGDYKYKRGGAHLGVDHVSDDERFKMAFSGRYSAQRNLLPGLDFTSLSRGLAPNAPEPYNPDGSLNWEDGTWENPYAQLQAGNIADTYDLTANTVLGYTITKGLDLKSSFGMTDLKNEESRSLPSSMYNPAFGVGSEVSSVFTHDFTRRSWIVEPQLNWKGSFGNHDLDVLIGGSFQHQNSERLAHYASGFSSDALLDDLTAASFLLVMANDKTEYQYQAFFGRVNYMFGKKYIINLTGRRDGSSRFGPGKQFATFGAVGAAWLFYKETFMADSFISFGKLRGSYGTTGNDQIGDYQFLDTYTSSGYDYQGIKGLQPVRLYNADFGWETNTKLEAALETGFLKDRIFMTAAWYRNRSSNQLVGIPLAGTTGFASIQSNLDATVENRGWEFMLRTVNVQGKDFNWTTNFNLTIPRNELLEFPNLEASTYRNTYVIGEPITVRKLFHFTGVNPTTGLYEFEDVNGDGQISYADDRQAVADFGPKYYGGLQNQFSYKGLQLDFLFQFVKQLNWNYANTQGYAGLFYNQPTAYNNSWMQPGDIAQHQVFTTGLNYEALQASEYYGLSDAAVSDASYIRLKNVALSYDLPLSNFKNFACRLVVQAQNLLTITSFEGADPEFREGGYLPPLRIVSGGLQLTF